MFPHDKLDWQLRRQESHLDDAPEDVGARTEYALSCLSKATFHGGGEVWHNRALTQARRILQADPSHSRAQVVAGLALVGLDRLEHAQRYLDEAVRNEPEGPMVRLALGALFRQRGDRRLAVRELETACRLAPGAWEPHYLLGQLLAEQATETGSTGRPLERAQFHTVRALQLGPSAHLANKLLYDLAISCLHTGRLNDAHKLLSRLQDDNELRHRASYQLGLVSYHMGKYKNAVLHLRKHLRFAPDNPRVHTRIGMAYLQLGEVVKAREACHRALVVEPADLQARWTLGCALLEEGSLEDAIKLFREILQDAPDHAPAFGELVRVRREVGDVSWLRKALRAEVGVYDRLPVRTERLHPARQVRVPVDPRAATKERVAVLVRHLSAVDDEAANTLLAAMDLTTDEGMRFHLWEATLDHLARERAVEAHRALRKPGHSFGGSMGREVLGVAQLLPEAQLLRGLQLDEDDLSRAAIDRHGATHDVGKHRANVERERQEARSWQAMLLLALGTRHTASARSHLLRWASEADRDLADVARAALVLGGDTRSADALRLRSRERGAEHLVDALLKAATPTKLHRRPRPVSDDESIHCTTCGRHASEAAHMTASGDHALCDRCVAAIASQRPTLITDDPHVACALSGHTPLTARAVYIYQGMPVCARCIDDNLGRLEREEIDRYLASW